MLGNVTGQNNIAKVILFSASFAFYLVSSCIPTSIIIKDSTESL